MRNQDRSGTRSISGPYVSPEATESVPLKGRGRSLRRLAGHPCGCRCLSDDTDGLRLILVAFALISIGIVIALLVQIRLGESQVVPHGAVVTDNQHCTRIGQEMLQLGGSAVDAAVACTLCMGVVHPHVTGLGGGGFMVIRRQRSQECKVVDFRETAPEVLPTPTPSPASPSGGDASSVGVPGLLRGLYLAHQHMGLLPWKTLVQPSAHLAREGVTLSQHLVSALSRMTNGKQEFWLSALFTSSHPSMSNSSMFQRQALADLLDRIALEGPNAFYQGQTAAEVSYKIQKAGGRVGRSDLEGYQARWEEGLTSTVLGYGVCTSGPPSAGPQLLAVLNLLERLNDTALNVSEVLPTHHVLEAVRITATYQAQLGDPYVGSQVANLTEQMVSKEEAAEMQCQVSDVGVLPEHIMPELSELVGTHVAVMDASDLHVSVVSGLGDLFGSGIVVEPLGIILNNALSHFSVPSNGATLNTVSNNSPGPGKRPLSKYAPALLWEEGQACGRRLATGATDASLAAEVLLGWLSQGQQLGPSVERARVIAQASSARLRLERGRQESLPQTVMDALGKLGYSFHHVSEPYPSVNMVQRLRDTFSAYADSRGGGASVVF